MTTLQNVNEVIDERRRNLLAYVYVRHSDPKTRYERRGSTDVQLSMYDHAIALGFNPDKILVVTKDIGISGTWLNIDKRKGFKEMLIDVATGRVGAIICSHSSRLARSSRDNHNLVLCCEINGTLIIDQDGIYDPTNESDRLFLGLKGVIDEADMQRIRSRMMESKLALAKKGELRTLLPTGFIWECAGRNEEGQEQWKIVKDKREDVQSAIKGVFDAFEQHQSALAVVRLYQAEGRKIPTLIRQGVRKGEYEQKPLSEWRLLKMLHNPHYAGSYVYGRYTIERRVDVENGFEVKACSKEVGMEEWKVHLPNFHEGYITLEQYHLNQAKLEDNSYHLAEGHRGAARKGVGLLQGVVFCKKCGYKMQVIYPKRKAYYYLCRGQSNKFGGKTCQSVAGIYVDKGVTRKLLEVFEPARLKMVTESVSQAEERARESVRSLEVSIKRVASEAEYAKYRYDQIDPKNSYAKEIYENDLNEKAAELIKLKQSRDALLGAMPRPIDSSDHRAIMKLAQDIPMIWYSERMTLVLRKLLLRTVIEEVHIDRDGPTVEIYIKWRTGVTTKHGCSLPVNSTYANTDIVDIIRDLSLTNTDQQIAEILNENGMKAVYGQPFSYLIVRHVRQRHKIPETLPVRSYNRRDGVIERRGDGRYSVLGAARVLGFARNTITTWCEKGLLDAIRNGPPPGSSWWIRLTPEQIQKAEEAARYVTDNRIKARLVLG